MNELFTIRAGILAACGDTGASIQLPGGIRSIGCQAFSNRKNLKEVILPEGLEEIEVEAFSGCTRLERIVFPSTLRKIKNGAFCGCSSLEKVTLPDGLEFIGRFAFEECTRLSKVVIPLSVHTIGYGAFRNCLLDGFEMEGRNFTHIYDVEILFRKGQCPHCHMPLRFGRDQAYHCDCPDSQDDPPYTMEVIRDWRETYPQSRRFTEHALRDLNDSTFGLPSERLLLFTPRAYDSFDRVEKNKGTHIGPIHMEIGGEISDIPQGQFREWDDLQSVRIRSSVTVIDDNAFAGCKNLTSIIIPSSVRYIGINAFAGCSNLRSVTILTGREGVDPGLLEIGEGAFFGCASLDWIELPHTVKELGPDAFKACTNLEGVILPAAFREKDDDFLYQVFDFNEDGPLMQIDFADE